MCDKILRFKWALSVAKRNWDVKLDLSTHKFADHQCYYLKIEVYHSGIIYVLYVTWNYMLYIK